MNKQEFLTRLGKGLMGLPKGEIEERLTFYREMIEDRMEEGLSEEEAVSAVGDVDEIIAQIEADVPPTKKAKGEAKSKRRLTVWEIVLLVLGSPIWLSLAIAAGAVVLSLYVVLWSVLISLWAVFGSLAVCAVGGAAGGVIIACGDNLLSGIAVIGAGLVCAGIAVFLFYGCREATKGTVNLTKQCASRMKHGL